MPNIPSSLSVAPPLGRVRAALAVAKDAQVKEVGVQRDEVRGSEPKWRAGERGDASWMGRKSGPRAEPSANQGASACRRHTSPCGRRSGAGYAASPSALRRRTVLFQYGGRNVGVGSASWDVGRLADRGEEAGDAPWLGHHGDELHPTLASRALEDIERKRAAQKLGAVCRTPDSHRACASELVHRPLSQALVASPGAVRCAFAMGLPMQAPARTAPCESAAAGRRPRAETRARADP
jgi:hypothetical protein